MAAGRPLLGLQPVDQHAQHQQRLGPAHHPGQLVGQGAQVVGLDLAVLVGAEHVLEALERLDHRLGHRGGPQAAEELEQVAQLLAALAQLVEVLGRARVVDGRAQRDHLLVDLADALAGHVGDRPLGVGALPGRALLAVEEGPVAGPGVPVGPAPQLGLELAQRRGPVPGQQGAHRQQRGVAIGGDPGQQLVPLEQLDVEVRGCRR